MRVKGEGPRTASIMFIGEAPGVAEDQTGKPFQGKSGRELTRYARQAGIDRLLCYVTNVVKERPQAWSATGNSPPTVADIKRDEPELLGEIASVHPKFIAAVGAVAARWLLRGKYDSMEAQHGLPFPLPSKRIEQLTRAGMKITPKHPAPTVVLLTHPAAGLHSADSQPQIYFDFQALGQYIRGELPLTTPTDQFPDPDYREIIGGSSKSSGVYLMPHCPVYVDTEGLLGNVWGLSFTQTPGTAAVIRVTNRLALASFRAQLKDMRVVMHHALHDIPIIAEMLGMGVEELLQWVGVVEDTMVKGYVLRNVPLGLKPFSRRYHGMTMDGYLDIVRDADRQIVCDWIRGVLEKRCERCGGEGQYVDRERVSEKTGRALAPALTNCEACEGDGTSLPSPPEYIEYEKGVAKVKRGDRIGRRLRRVLKDMREKPDETDPRARYENIDYMYRLAVEDAAGVRLREVSLNDVRPQKKAVDYSARDADATLRSDRVLDVMFDADEGGKLREVYEINRDTLPLLAVMMDRGTYLDVPYMQKLDRRLEGECDRILYKLEKEVGHYVNPASSKQVAELLFDEFQLPVMKETRTGDASTQDKVLEDLRLQVAAAGGVIGKGWGNGRSESENWSGRGRRTLANAWQWDKTTNERILRVFTYITDYRERHKLRGTYTLALPRKVDEKSRIHTTFNSTRTATNRLSSSDPNLQNIPARTDLGKLIRGGFVATPGFSLVSVDYSQIEVRVIAHMSKDVNLVKGIREGLDVHYVTASKIFRKPIEQVSKQERAISKRITFLILYGGGAPRLRAELRLDGIEVTIREAQGYIDAYLTIAYPGIGDYMLEIVAYARRYGYVEDMWGWRRYLPGVHSELDGVRLEAERMAVNAPIQSGAAGIMRKACPVILGEAVPYVRKKGFECYPLLTVHDEIVAEVREGGESVLVVALARAMTDARVAELDVPVLVDGKAAERWSELK